MNLNALRSQLSDSSWLTIANELIRHKGSLKLTSRESQALFDDLRGAIDRGEIEAAQNALYAGLLFDEERFVGKVQKKGLLRISRRFYTAEPLTALVHALMDPELGLSPLVTEYLASVANLYTIAVDIREDYLAIRGWLFEEREQGIKGALAWLDFSFLERNQGIRETGKDGRLSRDAAFFDIEELAEGISTVLSIYGNELGKLTTNATVNEKALLEGDYEAVLNAAAHISAFREWEFSVDRQGYRLIASENVNEWRLHHPSAEFHRAVEFGFIQSAQQRMMRAYSVRESGMASIRQLGYQAMPSLEKAGYIRVETTPIRRVRIEMPKELLTKITEINVVYLEEVQALENATDDLLTDVEVLLSFEVQDGLAFRDIFRVARAIDFIRAVAAARLIPEIKDDPGLVYQSIVPALERDQLIELLGACVGNDAAKKAIELWVVDVMGHVDIQYRPLVPVGASVLFPLNIFGTSNTFRNPLQILEKRLYEDGRNDPLSQCVAEVFDEKGFGTICHLSYSDGEIDVLAFVDGVLFAFECKNSLLPTGAHELMTSYDYVQIASDQLSRFKVKFGENSFRNWLSKQTGWPIDKDTHLSTGIVLSNRMFMGFRGLGHPVRNPYELKHFVENGTFQVGNESHNMLLGDRFTGEDLRRYLEEDITYQPQWESLEPWHAAYSFENNTVIVDHLRLNPFKLAELLGFNEAIQGLSQQYSDRQKIVEQYSFPDFYQSRMSDSDESDSQDCE